MTDSKPIIWMYWEQVPGTQRPNERLISSEDIDPECLDKMLYVPVYNTSPGFPKWFTSLLKEQLMGSHMLISKLFRKSLIPDPSVQSHPRPHPRH